ncbi:MULTISPECIES: DUF5685 family protein [unclassified Oscillibacter]|uniref:DUF5685 family protein n=1 Tax=unclassified Oscillibacter TaxID=2629304 RepID=UPI0025F8C443|nr:MULTISPECIES: DUF5685 family protein [unclassified Oscillibacter]
MFGYVRPPLDLLPAEEQERFRRAYCGLCHTLRRRCGLPARFILNYDFTFLAILLSGGEEPETRCERCVASPLKKRTCCGAHPALDLAADESVILAYWQARDGVVDHGFWKGLKYRAAALALRGGYRKAAAARPEFDRVTRAQLGRLAELEREKAPSLDAPADAFAQILAAAADEAEDGPLRRILHQLLYHLGRWVYLTDAADDLKEDALSGNYNPLIYRYGLNDGAWTPESRDAFTKTLDHSVRLLATAYELWDFGCWTPILEQTVYTGLFQVGKAVLSGTYRAGKPTRKKDRKVEETT